MCHQRGSCGLRGLQRLPLPFRDLPQQLLGLWVRLEVLPHRLQQHVHLVDELLLELLLADLAGHERSPQALEAGVGRPSDGHGEPLLREKDVLNVVQAGVFEIVLDQAHALLLCLRHLLRELGAVGVADLARHVLGRVLHEDGAVGVRLRHLRLPLLQAQEHVVRQDDGLQLPASRVAVVARQHIHFALVHPQLAHVRPQEEDIRALHDGVEDLCRSELVLLPTHDLATLLDPGQRGPAGDVKGLPPVRLRLAADLLGGPEELHA
mmetsp:Transcript_55279/g.143792  ORF Transcript_55279/g.143792 Transcript_55279/m.143792 type:complete len:265 (+) Transcript_55279:1142-1936(+)